MSATTIKRPRPARAAAITVPAAFLNAAAPHLKRSANFKSLASLESAQVICENNRITFAVHNLDAWIGFHHDEEPPADDAARILRGGLWVRRNGIRYIPIHDLCDAAAGAGSTGVIGIAWEANGDGHILWQDAKSGAEIRREFSPNDPAGEQYPPVPTIPDAEWQAETGIHAVEWPWLPADTDAVNKLAPFMSDDETRYVINGVCLDAEDRCFVATDGRRLATTAAAGVLDLEYEPKGFILPSNHILFRGLGRHPSTREAGLVTWLPTSAMFIRWPGLTCYFRPIEGVYPRWRQVIPNDHPTCTLHFDDPAATAKALDAMGKEGDIIINLRKDSASFRRGKTEAMLPGVRLEIMGGFKPFRIQFGGKFFTQALASGITHLQLRDEEYPGKYIAGLDRHVLMPMRMK